MIQDQSLFDNKQEGGFEAEYSFDVTEIEDL
jgi:hypothetical protein